MTRTEMITRLYEMVAEMEKMKQLDFLDADEKHCITEISSAIYLLYIAMQH